MASPVSSGGAPVRARSRSDFPGTEALCHSCSGGGPVLEELHQFGAELVITSKAAKCNRSWTGVRMPA